MNLRWLWMDHFPSGLDLTPAERKRIKAMARTHRKREPKFRGAHRMAKRGMIPFLLLCVGASITLPIWAKPLVDFGQIILPLTLTPAVLWVNHRSRRPFIRKALIDCGHPVCIECGYILRGVESEKCPECGTLRLQPEMHDRPLNPAELRNPEVVQLMARLGYEVCNHCGAMWFVRDQLMPRCPSCKSALGRGDSNKP